MRARNVVISVVVSMVISSMLGQAVLAAKTQGQKTRNTQSQTQKIGMAKRILSQLDLSTDQKAKIRAIFQDAKAKVQAIRGDGNLSDEQKKAQLTALRAEVKNQILAVLTLEQKQKLKQLIGKNKKAADMRGKLMAALAKLNLTDDQKAKVKAIAQDAKAKVQVIRGDSALSSEQKKTQLKALRADVIKQVMAELTPEQQQKLKQMISQAKGRKGGVK